MHFSSSEGIVFSFWNICRGSLLAWLFRPWFGVMLVRCETIWESLFWCLELQVSKPLVFYGAVAGDCQYTDTFIARVGSQIASIRVKTIAGSQLLVLCGCVGVSQRLRMSAGLAR